MRDLLEKGIPGEVIRFVFLQTHYTKPMDWTAEKAEIAQRHLDRWYALVGDVSNYPTQFNAGADYIGITDNIADDLNTSAAISRLHYLADMAEEKKTEASRRLLKSAANLLGLLQHTESEWRALTGRNVDLSPWAEKLSTLRAKALETKDFTPVDALKSALTAAGVEVRMSKAGVELLSGPGFDASKLEGL